MLAPAAAALAGIGVAAMWEYYRDPGRRGWLLPAALAGMAAVQARVLFDYPIWRAWLISAVAALCLVGAAILVLVRLRPPVRARAYAVGATTAGVLALLAAPAAWAAYTTWQGTTGFLPSAGPRSAQAFGPPGGGPAGPPPSGSPPPKGGPPPKGDPTPKGGGGPPGGGPPGGNADPALVEYLQANRGGAGYLVAVSGAMSAAPIILNTDELVVSLGGYNGIDPVFTVDELVDGGAVRFFLMPDRVLIEEMMAEREANGNAPPQGGLQGGPGPGGPGGGLPRNGSAYWIEDNCAKVPQELWQSSPDSERGGGGPPMMRARALFDCSGS